MERRELAEAGVPEAACLLSRRRPRATKSCGVVPGGEGERVAWFGDVGGIQGGGAYLLPPQAGVR